MLRRLTVALAALVALPLSLGCASRSHSHHLPSWNDTPNRAAIVEFVERVTDDTSPDFVPPDRRIAVFDNDGTLWLEQPLYTQAVFALDRVRALASQHPEWRTTMPFKAVLENDRAALGAFTEHDWAQIIAATHSGMTVEQFNTIASDWYATARNQRFNRPYTRCTYQPQVELLEYLRANGFKTFIVSGGGIEFMRPVTQQIYGIPPEQVVGSSAKTKFELQNGAPVLVKLPEIGSIDDKEGKPVNINLHIGLRPILAVGNSDGDLQMLQYTAIDHSPSLAIIIHHDDAAREYAYDRDSHVGRLDKALDEARNRGWVVVSMKNDWSRIFPAP